METNGNKAGFTVVSGAARWPAGQEVRSAVRFPLALPVIICAGGEERSALTRNVSANGVLFEMDRALHVGQTIQFLVRMPRMVLGTPHDILVDCQGRVVRCSVSQTSYQVAATIDEYQFVEQ